MVNQINTTLPFHGSLESRQGGRTENQDSCGFSDTVHGLLVIVCDGMGGGPGGKTASLLATQTIVDVVRNNSQAEDRGELLKDAILQAHDALLQVQQETPALRGMGTTVVALLINKVSAIVAHVGDSRLYKLRDGNKVYRTKDHSMVGELVRKKMLTEEQARLSAQSNIITRALGTNHECKVDIEEIAFEKGDRFVLCSDGIWGAFPESDLVKMLSDKKPVPTVVEKVAMDTDEVGKNNGGHHDNLTVAIVQTEIKSKKKEKMTKLSKQIIGILILLVLTCIGLNVYQYNKNKSVDKLNLQINDMQSLLEKKDALIQDLHDTINNKNHALDILKADVKVAEAGKKVAEATAEVEKAKASAEVARAEAQQASSKTGATTSTGTTTTATTTSSSNRVVKNSTSISDAIEIIIDKLNQLKKITEKKEDVAKHAAPQKDKIRVDVINDLVTLQKYKLSNKASELTQIKAALNTSDYRVIILKVDKDGSSTEAAKKAIDKVIKMVEKLKGTK